MNALAAEVLQAVWTGLKPRDRDPKKFWSEIDQAWCLLRDRWIDGRARWIWITHDPAFLQAEFDKRVDANGFHHFSFQTDDYEDDQETWIVAWQLAIEQFEALSSEEQSKVLPFIEQVEAATFLVQRIGFQPAKTGQAANVQKTYWRVLGLDGRVGESLGYLDEFVVLKFMDDNLECFRPHQLVPASVEDYIPQAQLSLSL